MRSSTFASRALIGVNSLVWSRRQFPFSQHLNRNRPWLLRF
jgi:hypothetical protein